MLTVSDLEEEHSSGGDSDRQRQDAFTDAHWIAVADAGYYRLRRPRSPTPHSEWAWGTGASLTVSPQATYSHTRQHLPHGVS